MTRYKGILYTVLSAFLFGFSPIIAKFCYAEGTNSITIVFLRGFLSLPFLYTLARFSKTPMRISKQELLHILPVGIIGAAMTSICLYSAFLFIGVGLGTTLHYCYPLLIFLIYFLLYRQKPGALKWCALVVGLLGIAITLRPGAQGSFWGIGLSLLSGLSYCVYLIVIDRTSLKDMNCFKLTFYICLVSSLSSFTFGAVTGQLQFPKSAAGWGASLLLALLISVGGLTLLQLGIASTSPSTVSLLYTVEPITSVLMGAILLGETLDTRSLFGILLILLGVVLVALAEKRESLRPSPPPPLPGADSF